ncbi:MAG: alpha-L-fucosidase [Anaerolineales bacterium]
MYEANWNSIKKHTVPQWFLDAKFGIYTHWGIYCVPAKGPNATWYPYNMYIPGTEQYEYHLKTYGGPEKFGYKDFIPMFTAENFDPDEWAEMFELSGAKYAGPVAEHHDGFPMWDTQYGDWNAAKMGPRRDVVGLLEESIRKKGLRFMVAFHHAENWWFYPHWIREYDTSDPAYTGLYGPIHNLEGPLNDTWFFNQDRPSQWFLDRWKARMVEVLDHYQPDLIWFDFGLRAVPEAYKLAFLANYYNRETEWGREVVVTYKDHDLAPGAGVVDLELGRMSELTYYPWLTDTTVDDGNGWGYLKDTKYKSATSVVHYLIDNVSKNGHLLLNIGPKPDGTFPEEAKEILREMGEWLKINGEAIYGSTTWVHFGEGPNIITKTGSFNEQNVPSFSAQDVRFTVQGRTLYAICLGWPEGPVTIETLKTLWAPEITSVRMLGVDQVLEWSLSERGLTIVPPSFKPCNHAVVFKIERGSVFR